MPAPRQGVTMPPTWALATLEISTALAAAVNNSVVRMSFLPW